jgi:hypothetical protein
MVSSVVWSGSRRGRSVYIAYGWVLYIADPVVNLDLWAKEESMGHTCSGSLIMLSLSLALGSLRAFSTVSL